MEVKSGPAKQPSKMTMIRNVHFACGNCGAPGEYRSEDWVRNGYTKQQVDEMVALDPSRARQAPYFISGWPEVWVQPSDPKRGQAVGETCPCCGSRRKRPKRLNTMKILGRFF